MSYTPGTILSRKQPFTEPAENSTEIDNTPYNEIEVIGHSPVHTGVRNAEWNGQAADAFSIKPTTFGAVIDRAFGELQRDYDVKSIPEPPMWAPPVIERYVPGPTPEEQFAAIAQEATKPRKRASASA